MIKFTPLFSGSRGNCTLVQSQDANILIDLGFGYTAIKNRLAEMDIRPSDVDAILITHEHTDHIAALQSWSRLNRTKVYAHKAVADYISEKTYCTEIEPFDAGFQVDGLNIDFFPCSHDARFCCGYRFTDGKEYAASVTDTGCVTEALVGFLKPCRTVLLESNHDVDMLKRGEYPYPLKRRILSENGHLSNAQTAEILDKLLEYNARNIILGHLSERNNTHEIAFAAAMAVVEAKKMTEGRDVNIYVADQYKRSETIE